MPVPSVATHPNPGLVTAIVRFHLPPGTTRVAAREIFAASVPLFREVRGLIRKYFLFGEGPTGGGVYLWQNRAAAEAFYSIEWRELMKQRFGMAPTILMYDTPVLVDNRNEEVVVD